MELDYNGNLTYQERINKVSKEITSYYKEINEKDATLIASLEDPITTQPTLVIKFMRLFNILFVIQNNKSLFNKIYNDLENNFKIYLSKNINDYKIDKIMEEVIKYKKRERLTFPIISEFTN